jgi:hypothetical protein
MSQFVSLPAYDAENTGEYGNFDPVPAGSYLVRIEDYEIKETSAGDMAQFCLTYRIVDGDFESRIIFDRINIENLPGFPVSSLEANKQKAIAIGNSARKSLELATFGRSGIRNPQEFIGKMLVVTVKVREAEGKFPASNSVTRYSPAEQPQAPAANGRAQATVPAAHAAPAPAQASGPASTARKVPWKK